MTVTAITARADLEAVIRLDEQIFKGESWGRTDLVAATESDVDVLRAVTDNGNVIGYGLMRVSDDADILRIAVEPSQRRRGAAGALLKSLIAESGSRGCGRVFLEVRESNLPAVGLYSKTGFVFAGRRKRYYSDPEEDALIMFFENTSEMENA